MIILHINHSSHQEGLFLGIFAAPGAALDFHEAPQVRTLDTSWSRWIVEPFGYGQDEKGTSYRDLSFWNTD